MPTSATSSRTAGTLSSGTRCMQVLELLSSADEDLPLQEIASRLRLHPSTTHRLLATLVRMGFVDQRSDRRYCLGLEAFVVGCGYLRRSVVRRAALPILMSLAEQTQASSNLAFWQAGRVVVVDCIPMPGMYRFYSQPGEAPPLHATALGKCLLAFRDGASWKRLEPLTRYTERTICNRADLVGELLSIRKKGYAIDNEEYLGGCRCIAVPLLQNSGEPTAAISISGPLDVISDAKIPELSALIRDRCLNIALHIGYRPRGYKSKTSAK